MMTQGQTNFLLQYTPTGISIATLGALNYSQTGLSADIGSVGNAAINQANDPIQTFQSVVVSSGNITSNQTVTINKRTAGEVVAVNDALYLKKSDGRVYRAIASSSNDAIYNFIGFAAENASATGQIISVFESGYVGGFTSLTPGSWYFLTNTAGQISTTPGTYQKRIGMAVSSTEIYIIRDSFRVFTANGQFNVTNLGANPGTSVVTTGFRPAMIIGRFGMKRSNASMAWTDTTSTTVYTRTQYFATWYGGTYSGFNVNIAGGAGAGGLDTTALMKDSSAGGSPKLTITTLTDTSFTIRFDNDGTNEDESALWEVIAIA